MVSEMKRAFDAAIKAKHDHFHGKNPCLICWNFFGSMEWAAWINSGHKPEDHPCREKERLDAEVTRTCDAWVGC